MLIEVGKLWVCAIVLVVTDNGAVGKLDVVLFDDVSAAKVLLADIVLVLPQAQLVEGDPDLQTVSSKVGQSVLIGSLGTARPRRTLRPPDSTGPPRG